MFVTVKRIDSGGNSFAVELDYGNGVDTREEIAYLLLSGIEALTGLDLDDDMVLPIIKAAMRADGKGGKLNG